MRQLIKSTDEKIGNLEEERKLLFEQLQSNKSLYTAVETHLSPVKHGSTTKSATLDLAGWDEFMRRTAPVVPRQRGMFSEVFDCKDESRPEDVIKGTGVLLKLDEKMRDEEAKEPARAV